MSRVKVVPWLADLIRFADTVAHESKGAEADGARLALAAVLRPIMAATFGSDVIAPDDDDMLAIARVLGLLVEKP